MSAEWLENKTVLVTGASGTVGRGLISAILAERPRVLRCLDSYEHGLFQLHQELGEREEVRWLLGDIRDASRLARAMEGVDVVFHAAALKHVAIGEYNPFEIVQTNLVGLQNIIQGALDANVERVIFTSSDKAVNPTNAMGASKLMGERLVAAAHQMRGTRATRFASVRFGNILGSNGSVVEIFRNQIARGGPVTLTDARMTRFVMGLPHAVQLLLRAAELTVGGELFVLKMPALRIRDLAQVMIDRLAPLHGYRPEAIPVVEIGPKPGEKLFEELLSDAEVPHSYEDEDLILYPGEVTDAETFVQRPFMRYMRPVEGVYHSERGVAMTSREIEAFLVEMGVFGSLSGQEVAL